MHAFAGIIGFARPIESLESEERLGRALGAARRDRPRIVRVDRARVALSQQRAPGAFPAAPWVCEAKGGFCLVDARLDNRAELVAALNLAPIDAARMHDGDCVAQVYARFGDAGLARVVGAFVLVDWDADAGRLTLARDCLGERSLFFHHGDGFVAFASALPALLALSIVPRAIDELAVADYLVLNKNDRHQTLYRGIERVPTRSVVAFDRTGPTHRTYWAPDLHARLDLKRHDDLVQRARELFDQAVAAAIAGTPDVAISLSGGFDSSAIAATVVRLGQSASVTGYSLVAPPGYDIRLRANRYLDERTKLDALVAMYPSIALNMFAPEVPHPDADAERLFVETGLPIYNNVNSGFFTYIFRAVSQARAPALLTGLSGNFGLTWRGKMWLSELARTGQWGRLAAELVAFSRSSGEPIWRLLAQYVGLQLASPRLLDAIYPLIGRDVPSVSQSSAINPDFIAQNNLTKRWYDQGFDAAARTRPGGAAALRAMHLFDANQAGRDYRYANGARNGFEYRDPHADRRLLEFALAVPETVYHQGGERSFARAVFADRLPRAILDETRVGQQAIGWFRHLEARRGAIADEVERIAASPLANRLIDVARLKALMADWPKDEQTAVDRNQEFQMLLMRGVQMGQFVRWVEGSNG